MQKVVFSSAMMLGLCLVATVYAEGELTLRVMAINPSKDQAQNAEVKAYLPKEIRMDDVLEKGDLEVTYDNQQGAYFVYGQYDLKPGETLEREIQIRDVWRIPDEELESLRAEATKTAALLVNTDFQERVNFLKTVIDTKLSKIIERQNLPAVSPDKHISKYRDNLALLESVKQDMLLARSLLAQAKPTRSLGAIWKLFVGIVLFLGLLGLGSYVIWQTQLKTTAASTFGTEFASEPQVRGGQRREAKEDKPIDPEDIQKIINEGS